MYQVKSYSKDKVLKQTINPKIIKNRISFTKQINGGFGELRLLLNLPITNTDYIEGDLIEVYYNNNGILQLIYTGYIDRINIKSTDIEEIELIVYGLSSLFTKTVYNVAGNYTANLNDDPYNLIDDIVTQFNTKYNYLTLDGELLGTSISYDLNYTDTFKLLNDLNNLSPDFYWFLDNYKLIFKQKPTTADYTFTLKKDIIELNIENDTTELVNTLILKYKTGTATYTDATSISTYGIREKFIDNSEIADLTTANQFGTKYIADNKDPKKKISLIISNKFLKNKPNILQDLIENLNTYTDLLNSTGISTIENISPGESCKIRNTKSILSDNLIISKISYNQDKIKLDLEKYDNFIQLIKQ